jgi:hypothetical protein
MNKFTKSDLLGFVCLVCAAIAYYYPSKHFSEADSLTLVSMLVGGGLALLNGGNFLRKNQ